MGTKSASVAERIRGLIHDGRLREGEPLPSTRGLASELGVARGTIVTAYEQLDGEGYIQLRHGTRAVVAASFGGVAAAVPRLARPAQTAFPSSPRIDLTPGLPSITSISEREWRAAWRSAASQTLVDAFPPAVGEPALREQITAQLALSRGFAPSPDRVVIASGTAEAISLIVEALGPVRIVVENPGYRSGRVAITSAGGVAVPIPLDEGGLDLDALRAEHRRAPVSAVMVTPSHQYPLGAVMPVSRRSELIEWAAAERVLVIEDDYDSEFRHHGSPLPALAAIDTAGVVAHIGSFSKVLNPQLRCGYLVLPEGESAAASAILSARTARGATVATPVQAAIAQLMSSGALRRHIARCRREYSHKRGLVAEALHGLDGVRVSALGSGLHAVVEFAHRPAAEVVQALADRGIVTAPLQLYVVAGSGLELNGLILGYGAVGATALTTALAAIAGELAVGRRRSA